MKTLSRLLPILLITALGNVACAPRHEDIPEATVRAWEEAFNKADAAGVAAVYTEDAIVMPPNMPTVQGRAAIEKWMSEGFGQGHVQISIDQDDWIGMGGTGVRRGTYRITGDDGAVVEVGKYVEVWEKKGDTWQLAVDIWNADTPPAPPAAPAPQATPPATPPPG